MHSDEPFWKITHGNATLDRWHRILSKVLIGLGTNQLISGIAVTVSSTVTYGLESKDPHTDVASHLGLTSLLSQFLVPFVVQEQNRNSAACYTAWSIAAVATKSSLIALTCLKRVDIGHVGDNPLVSEGLSWVLSGLYWWFYLFVGAIPLFAVAHIYDLVRFIAYEKLPPGAHNVTT